MQKFLLPVVLGALLASAPAARAQFITNTVGVNINATSNRIFDATNNPNPPPAVSSTTSTFTFTVSTSLAVTDVDLRLSVLHSWIGDLDIFLISPTGIQMALTNLTVTQNTSGTNYQDTYIDEQGGVLRIGSGGINPLDQAPYAGPEYGGVRYKSQSALDTLSKFNGIDPFGTWTLKIIDGALLDDGILLWPGANPQQLDDLISGGSTQAGQAWGTNAIGTQLIITTLVPEPGSVALMALGFVGVGLFARRFRHA